MSRLQRIHKNKKIKPTYWVLVDGNTEKWYLEQLRDSELSFSNFTIEPKLSEKVSLNKKIHWIIENAYDFDKIIWIIDFDDFLKQEQEKEGKIQELKTQISHLRKKLSNVEILFNVPCLEFWFLLHFIASNKFFPKCSDVEKILKKYIPDYEKTEKYFKNPRLNIFQRLKEKLSFAYKNAEKLGKFDFENYQMAKAEIYLLLEILQLVK
ncbi:MAG: RloB family protein [Raineya sp.]|nr:RloB family protein [Raineya sp.]MDW8296011.1 RloB family protein [Raineya sp.]